MNHEKLSKRLACVASFVPHQSRMADIGSDHAYLPCHLALSQHIAYAIAGEVVDGPFQSAKQHVESLQLTNKIDVRLGNGLDVLCEQDNIDTLTICGMGGELIASILERGRLNHQLKTVQTLILQPNVAQRHVRQWLMAHQYTITNECIVMEHQKIYEIIVAKPAKEKVSYTPQQLEYGVYLPQEKAKAFVLRWQYELKKYEMILNSLTQSTKDESAKMNEIRYKIDEIKEILYGKR